MDGTMLTSGESLRDDIQNLYEWTHYTLSCWGVFMYVCVCMWPITLEFQYLFTTEGRAGLLEFMNKHSPPGPKNTGMWGNTGFHLGKRLGGTCTRLSCKGRSRGLRGVHSQSNAHCEAHVSFIWDTAQSLVCRAAEPYLMSITLIQL